MKQGPEFLWQQIETPGPRKETMFQLLDYGKLIIIIAACDNSCDDESVIKGLAIELDYGPTR